MRRPGLKLVRGLVEGVMNMPHFGLAGVAFGCCLALLGCASAPAARNLESTSLAGASFGSGQSAVQFTATDHWTASPTTSAPIAPMWGTCGLDNQPTTGITVTQTGLASCVKGATGTFEVFVTDPRAETGPVCALRDACGRGCQIMGSAQITCP